jgi:hypothetical protein
MNHPKNRGDLLPFPDLNHLFGAAAADSHTVEGTVDEEEGDGEEGEGQDVGDGCALVVG